MGALIARTVPNCSEGNGTLCYLSHFKNVPRSLLSIECRVFPSGKSRASSKIRFQQHDILKCWLRLLRSGALYVKPYTIEHAACGGIEKMNLAAKDKEKIKSSVLPASASLQFP